MSRAVTIDDPRLQAPQSSDLRPVTTEHENPWFAVRNRGGYYTIEYHYPQVMVLPIVRGHGFVMVRSRRPVINDTPLEVPAGGLEEGETPLAAAQRELREETGIDIPDHERFRPIKPFSILPRMPRLPYCFEVHIDRAEFDRRGTADPREVVEVVCLSTADAIDAIVNGEIYIALQCAVLARYLFSRRACRDIEDCL